MYTIRIYASRMPIPIQFTLHTWIVTEHEGKSDRFDILHFLVDGTWEREGHFYKNYHWGDLGCPMFALMIGPKTFFHDSLQWKPKILFTFEREEGSKVADLYKLLHENHTAYPYWNTYSMLPGPNSNTFTQWALDYIEPGKHTLPWGAWGREYTFDKN